MKWIWKNHLLCSWCSWNCSLIILTFLVFKLYLITVILKCSILLINLTHILVQLLKVAFLKQLLHFLAVSCFIKNKLILQPFQRTIRTHVFQWVRKMRRWRKHGIDTQSKDILRHLWDYSLQQLRTQLQTGVSVNLY